MATPPCQGVGLVVSTKGDPVPPCRHVPDLIAEGEPLAVVAESPQAGATYDTFDEIKDLARKAGRDAIMVIPEVQVEEAEEEGWRSTIHARKVRSIENAAALRTVCATGIVAVCGTDTVLCLEQGGRHRRPVETESLEAALIAAVGSGTRVCSRSCPEFEEA